MWIRYVSRASLITPAVVIDRAQALNQGVENSTLKVEDKFEHYEYLERYDTGDRYVVRE